MKKLTLIFLSFTIYFNSISTFAGAAEKWEILENVYDTPTNTVNVTAKKITQEVANDSVYKVKVPVVSSALGKTVKSMLWTGLALTAVEAMLNGIGWVIDTGSQTIKKPKEGQEPPIDGFQYKSPKAAADDAWWNTLVAAGKHHIQLMNDSDANFKYTYKSVATVSGQPRVYFVRCYTSNLNNCIAQEYNNINKRVAPANLPPPEFITMSDTQLGDELTGKGDNKTPLPLVIADAYNPNNPLSEQPAPKATNDALNKANPQPQKEPDGKAETDKEKDDEGNETGKTTTSFELPNFCEWAPAVCDFFTVQKTDNAEIKENQKLDTEQNKTFFEKVTDWFDWTKKQENPTNDETEVDIIEETLPQVDTSILNAAGQCPPDFSYPFPLPMGGTFTITYSYATACYWFSKLYYIVVSVAWIIAFRIVTNTNTGNSENG